MGNVLELKLPNKTVPQKRAKISVSLRNLSRQCRKEIIGSFSFQSFWFGNMTIEQYTHLLQIHYFLRKTLEDHLKEIGPTFYVTNRFDQSLKRFRVDEFITPNHYKADALLSDIIELTGIPDTLTELPEKALELEKYIARAAEVYSVSLLGILYMLEETITYAGPHIAKSLEKNMGLKGRALAYLKGSPNQKADLWAFRQSLDKITDFQTCANIVIASTLTYRMYRDLLDPKQLRRLPQSTTKH